MICINSREIEGAEVKSNCMNNFFLAVHWTPMIGVQDVLQAVTGMAQDGSKKPTPVYQPPKFRLRVPREDARRDDCEAQVLARKLFLFAGNRDL